VTNAISRFSSQLTARRRGGIGRLVGWFIRIVIYDICISTIQEVTGLSRMASLFVFLGVLAGLAFLGYIMRQRTSPSVDA